MAREQGTRPLIQDDFVTAMRRFAHGGDLDVAGWLLAPESADFKLAKIRAGLDFSMPVRTLPPDPKAIRCMMVWIGAKEEPELWCPAAPPLPEKQAPDAVPTS